MGRVKLFISKHPALGRIIFFFPIQLVLVQLKKNPVLIAFWLILLGFVTGKIASRYGLSLLFIDPEYLGKVNFLSFAIIGFSCGGFIMAYQMASYIHNSFRFPFLATVSRPFVKFCMNNTIIPGIFIVIYLWNVAGFLKTEPIGTGQILLDIAGFILGCAFFITISLLYFFRVGKDIAQMFGIKEDHKSSKVKRMILYRDPKQKQLNWRAIHSGKEERDWHVETYFISFFRIRRARPCEHYDKEILNSVFRQNHGRAVLFEILVIVTLLLFGLVRDNEYVMIPAGASVFLLLTLYLMFTGILTKWFRGWSNFITVLLLLIFNWVVQFDVFNNRTMAYGLNYSVPAAEYSSRTINELAGNQDQFNKDSLATIAMLEKWYAQNSTAENPKPKMSIISCSGGGLRSTLWTFYTMRYLDSLSGNNLMNQSSLICGSSGGMLGAAYYRELYYRDSKSNKAERYNEEYLNSISSDLLNPIAFSVAVNDWFLPLRNFTYGNQNYSMNRAYALEEAIHRNTSSVLDKPISAYKDPEVNAEIPMMVLAPTIVNDGRKLLISSQGISYLTTERKNDSVNFNFAPDAVEFGQLFAKHSPNNLRFSSAIRMSATFPYITPLTELPTEPMIEVFDAGMRDNIGTDNILRFLYTFRDWIGTHTSGIVVIQTRDKIKVREPEKNAGNTLFKSLSKPLASFYGNLFGVQDYNHDRELLVANTWMQVPLDILDFELKNTEPDIIALSWHLTEREKNRTTDCMTMESNKRNIARYKELMTSSWK